MDRLKGKNTIITGAAGGQGRVACRIFAAEGARILASDVNREVAQEIEALAPGAITYVAADVTKADGIRTIVDGALKAFGRRIDVLYNNHGVILGKPFRDHARGMGPCARRRPEIGLFLEPAGGPGHARGFFDHQYFVRGRVGRDAKYVGLLGGQGRSGDADQGDGA